jgi:hypothetical protein
MLTPVSIRQLQPSLAGLLRKHGTEQGPAIE